MIAIRNVQICRTVSGEGHLRTQVARITWEENGKTYGREMPTGEGEEALLMCLEKCLKPMLLGFEYRITHPTK